MTRPDPRITWLLDRALSRFCDGADRLVREGYMTEQDVTSALSAFPDFRDCWADYVSETAR